jgi:hypothetical protein
MSRSDVANRPHRHEHRPVRRVLQVAAIAVVVAWSSASCSGGDTSDAPNDRAAVTAATSSPARFEGYSSSTYAQDRYWLCRPGGTTTNHCLAASLDSTIVRADGTSEVAPHEPAQPASAEFDCFYVYPTIPGIDFGPDQLNDVDPLTTLPNKVVVLGLQAARFTEACNVYAPVYRAMTQSGWTAPPDEREAALDLAYRDVHDAFKHYMANFNDGRPFVLIGHSQGSIHLERLIRDELDDDPGLRQRFISGLLIGGTVQTPRGEDVGGSFETVPLCRTETQRSCVIAFNSYAGDPPPDPAIHNVFGHDGPDTVAACTNPAALGGGAGELTPYLPSALPSVTVAGVTVTTPYVQVPHAISAVCTSGGGMTYLAMSPSTEPGDPRNVEQAVTNSGFWGLHLMETNLTQGNLIDLVRRQSTPDS